MEYAKLCQSHWINGKDVKIYTNFDRVIDKEKRVYKNRKMGLLPLVDPKRRELASALAHHIHKDSHFQNETVLFDS